MQAQAHVAAMRQIDDDSEKKLKKEKDLQLIKKKRIEITTELRAQIGFFCYEQYLIDLSTNTKNLENKYPELIKYPETSNPSKNSPTTTLTSK